MLLHKSYLDTHVKSAYISENQNTVRRQQNRLLTASISLKITFPQLWTVYLSYKNSDLNSKMPSLKKKNSRSLVHLSFLHVISSNVIIMAQMQKKKDNIRMHLLLILSEWKKIILARNERRSDVLGRKIHYKWTVTLRRDGVWIRTTAPKWFFWQSAFVTQMILLLLNSPTRWQCFHSYDKVSFNVFRYI